MMKLRRLLLIILGVPLLLLLAAWVSSYASLDHGFSFSRSTAELDHCQPGNSVGPDAALCLIEAGAFVFRARTAGFGGGRGNVILLHGFPESSAMYEPMIPVLARAGYQVVAFDQRGYSPGARPSGVEAYATGKLVADVFAVADAVGFDTFHLVGHDWGAAVGWQAVFEGSPRIRSWSALSIPHMGAYAAAIQSDADQQERSAYVRFFRLPRLPEMLFSFNGFAMMRSAIYSSHARKTVDEYIAIFSEPGALTAAFNWYRASDISDAPPGNLEVTVPTAFIWGNQDPVVGDRVVDAQRQYFSGSLRETELDTGHWLLETEPQAVIAAVLSHIEAHRESLRTLIVEPE